MFSTINRIERTVHQDRCFAVLPTGRLLKGSRESDWPLGLLLGIVRVVVVVMCTFMEYYQPISPSLC